MTLSTSLVLFSSMVLPSLNLIMMTASSAAMAKPPVSHTLRVRCVAAAGPVRDRSRVGMPPAADAGGRDPPQLVSDGVRRIRSLCGIPREEPFDQRRQFGRDFGIERVELATEPSSPAHSGG